MSALQKKFNSSVKSAENDGNLSENTASDLCNVTPKCERKMSVLQTVARTHGCAIKKSLDRMPKIV